MNTSISDTIRYVGVDDLELDLFESQYIVPNGISYNSYLVFDEQVALMDAVDSRMCDEWLEKVQVALDGRTPDYLVVHHMEPDHSGSIVEALKRYPEMKIVSSARAIQMLGQFFDGVDFSHNTLVVKEGDSISLGSRELKFYTAAMVHWPEVIFSYDTQDKVVFSADAFGKFGALSHDEEWACEARRYYFNICGKYGAPVQAMLKKVAALDVACICPLHGPVLKEDLAYYIGKYQLWTTYTPEDEGITIAYASIYGNTGKAAQLLAEELEKLGAKVALHDLARCDQAETVEDAFRYPKLVLAASTYNNDVFPFMKTFIHHLTERNYQNRTIALIESGSWAPMAAKVMKKMLENSKNLTFTEATVKIFSAMNDKNVAEIDALVDELTK